jgi:hypothetical protein
MNEYDLFSRPTSVQSFFCILLSFNRIKTNMYQIIVSKGEEDERYDHLIVLIMISNHQRHLNRIKFFFF